MHYTLALFTCSQKPLVCETSADSLVTSSETSVHNAATISLVKQRYALPPSGQDGSSATPGTTAIASNAHHGTHIVEKQQC